MLGAHKSAKPTTKNCKIFNQKKIYISSFLLVFVYFVSHVCLRLQLSLIWKTKQQKKTSQVAGTDAPSTSTATTPRRHSGTPKERSASSASASASKVSRRSRSKSPFRSFRWKRGTSKAEVSDDEGGIENKTKKTVLLFSISYYLSILIELRYSVEPSLTVSLVHDLFVVSWTVSFSL